MTPMILCLPEKHEIAGILHLDKGELPSFPQVVTKLFQATRDDTASLKDFSKILETDPGLSAQILRIVNSAMYNTTGDKITTVSDAVVMLGLEEIKKQALGVAIFKHMFKDGCTQEFDRLLFWRHCLAVAVLSGELSKKTGYINPEEAYTAGLLHDVGKIFMDRHGRKDFGEFIRSLSTSADLVIEHEREHFSLGHDDIGAYFCAQWALPDKLTAAVKYHHQPFHHLDLPARDKALIAIVSLADFICWTQGMGSFDFIRPPVLAPEVEDIIDLGQDDIMTCIQAMNMELESISAFYQFAFPSPEQMKENLLAANLKLSKINTQYYYQENPLEQIKYKALENHDALALEQGFAKPLAKAKSVKEVLDILMYQIGRIFKPKNWSILLKEPKSERLVFSLVVGKNKEKLLGVKLPKGEGIAGHIMETGESLIVEDVSGDKRFSNRVDTFTGFKTQSIICTPLKTGDKKFGVIQLINRDIEGSFTQKDMTLLSSIAEYAAIATERIYYTQALTNLATRDALTGLKNKWSFERSLGNKAGFQMQYGNVFSLLIIRLKGFGRMADENGQTVSDRGIKSMVQIMTTAKRREDALFRYGEHAFLMLLPITYSDGAHTIKERIEKTISKGAAKLSLSGISAVIASHTLNRDDIKALKGLVASVLSEAAKPISQEEIADIEDNLQPMVEKEVQKETAALRDKKIGKSVSLRGHYLHPRKNASVSIHVHQISLAAIGFTTNRANELKPEDFLDIQFVLDDLKRSVIKRQIVLKDIEGDYVRAEFYNPPPYAANLGFYMIN